MKVPTVIVVGSLNTDVVTVTSRVPDGGETLQATSFSIGCGGKGANQAVAAARTTRSKPVGQKTSRSGKENENACNVRMVGAVGDDTFGQTLKQSLQADGVDVGLVQALPEQTTGTATIIVEESSGENRILYVPGANHALTAENSTLDAAEYGDVVLFQLETPHEVVFHHIQAAKAAGAIVILNPSPVFPVPADILKQVDYLILNEGEALALLGEHSIEDRDPAELTSALIKQGVDNVLLTLGAKGVCMALSQRNRDREKTRGEPSTEIFPAQKVKAVDTTAAGDTFAGAFAARLASIPRELHEASSEYDCGRLAGMLGSAVSFAQKAAAVTVRRPGAQTSIPWKDEIET